MKKFLLIVNFFMMTVELRKYLNRKLFIYLLIIFSIFCFKPTPIQAQTYPDDNKSVIKTISDLFYIWFSGSANPQGGENVPNFPTISVHNPNITPGGPAIPTGIYNPNNVPFNPPAGYKYYAQCGMGPGQTKDYSEYPLPNGCSICKAGCGPSTVSMIISSLANTYWEPDKVVDYYRSHPDPITNRPTSFYAGCDGSGYSDAKKAIDEIGGKFGLRTGSLRVYQNQPIDQVASDFKNILASGWTIFALANYCEGGCGHFFWIIDIDENNQVWAYDPYYGRREAPPINENRYYPFPKYRVAFGVRKN